ncbi:MAG: hypothetical protein U1E96_03150 [Azonexus sp.]
MSVAAVLVSLLLADQLLLPPLPGSSNPAHLAPHAQVVLARDGTPLRAFPDRAHIWRDDKGSE